MEGMDGMMQENAVQAGVAESLLHFYRGKRVLVTGHTGFKGAWLCKLLLRAGADITGYALEPPTDPSLFDLLGLAGQLDHHIGDIQDLDRLSTVYRQAKPDIVLHLAAQPLVSDGYTRPVETYGTNVMGTVNVLECVRLFGAACVVNVTTDKVYQNNEWHWGYRENERLNGHDPYSNSKSCSELVTESYRKSFLQAQGVAVSTARAGNVIGGGDFAANRIVPDCVRAALDTGVIRMRNPDSIRPFQHVLEPVLAYLLLAQATCQNPALAGCYNIGPDDCDCVNTRTLTALFCDAWGPGMRMEITPTQGPHEANFLKLDCSKFKAGFNWYPRWHIGEAMRRVVAWTQVYQSGGDLNACCEAQIDAYLKA